MSFYLLILSSILASISAWADSYGTEGWTNEVGFGLDARYYDYKEYVDLPKASTESGWLPGLTASYDGENDWLSLVTQVYFSPGSTGYAGTTQTAVPISGTTQNIFFNMEEDVGWKFGLGFTLYSGISYNLWMRDVDPLDHVSYTGLEEDYTWWNIPLGLSWKVDLSDVWSLTVGAEADFMISAQIDAKWSGVTQGAANSVVPLGTTLGGKAFLKFAYRINPAWGLTLMPFYQYSGFIESQTFELLGTNGAPILSNGQPQFFDEPSSSHRSYGATVALTLKLK